MCNIARLFCCANCRCQVTICSYCDRGNIYCQDCAQLARKKSKHAAAKRYQKTQKGKLNHAKRQKAYRLKKNRQKQKVTHHGSTRIIIYDSLVTGINNAPIATKKTATEATKLVIICDFCGKCCSNLRRIGFIHHQNNKNRSIPLLPTGP